MTKCVRLGALWSLSPLEMLYPPSQTPRGKQRRFGMIVSKSHHRETSALICRASLQNSQISETSQPRIDAKKVLNSESSLFTHLVHQRQVVVIRRHRQHQPVLEVQRYLMRVSVLANQRVQRIAVGHLQTKRAVIL